MKVLEVFILTYSFVHFKGGFTLQGLQDNITVGILFIDAWLRGMSLVVAYQNILGN